MAISAADINTGLGYTNTALGYASSVTAIPLTALDEKIMAAERTKIAQSVKKMYATYISQALSIRTHTAVMVGTDSTQRTHLDRDVVGGKSLLEETADYYEKGRSQSTYRIMRKMADMGRDKLKKKSDLRADRTAGLYPGRRDQQNGRILCTDRNGAGKSDPPWPQTETLSA
ncbi:hypothetical protein JC862_07425 [Morganella morganii]|uniref:hypothetical protein n=1 Tax=Morganella morganii TaxID=582 RepID=UPI001C4750FE|nr:hypothetical protein [Morganella morganii]QXO44060.1 hypothetical protein CXB74_007565 [Morganella morganii]QXO47650.1 hypothetical protein JC862_07425 [Morganella morganii]